ncbi:MAG TPA: hypothetical protein VGP73_04975 [Thermoanaerobaculia bacterium]
MKKQVQKKKLMLAKETLRGLDNLDGLRYVAGGLTVESGCTCSCCTCVTGCESDQPVTMYAAAGAN